ncbi:amino acid adenylation domain-containing protein [Nocardia sp. CA-128927]|uniref:non-ribosomal peptide synthetase n=1 Tax=Nocardia sp. CA-128927 TaxID=3239975 RepID=UPI003D97FE37
MMATAVEANPDGVALTYADATTTLAQLSYAELDERSTRLARLLIERGVGPEDLVAIGVPRSIESVLAVWAVAKSGAGFVPVDPNYPADRIEHMVKDSGAVFGLTTAQAATQLPGQVEWLVIDSDTTLRSLERHSTEPITNADRVRQLRAEHPAWVIYTSGSTGVPKGVVATQAGLAGFCEEQRTHYGVTSTARTLHFSSPSFDASMLELLLALGGAATMVVVAPTVFGGDDLAELLRRERVTHAFITPAALASIDPAGLDDLGVVAVGGEAWPPDLVRRWILPVSGGVRALFNVYGPTETTIVVNIGTPLVLDAPLTIGGPIRGVTEYVLDERLSPVPDGVVGELYIAGAQVARGYHERPALTATHFVANPFDPNGSRLYRSGDLVRWVDASRSDSMGGGGRATGGPAEGRLEYAGRNDLQVKVRGFRIELGEIDAVLATHDSVDFAVTVGHQLDSGTTILASYVLAAPGAAVDTDELIAVAEHRLPAHMVPTIITVLDEIPLSPTGKLDRRALPAPQLQTKEFRAPSGQLEQLVAQIFAELLDAGAPIGADDDFFELGGNSLIATKVVARIGAQIGARVPARTVFEAPTVAGLAERLAPLTGSGGRQALARMPRPEHIPLSLAQQRMWFLNQFDTASAANNIPFAIRLSGALDVPALRAAVADLVERHETLRTVYPAVDGTGYQVVLPAEQATPELSISEISESELPSKLAEFMLAGFDVAVEVPLRMALLHLGSDDYVLAVVVHHIAADGTSMAPMVQDLTVAYFARTAGAAPGWAPLPVQYADYALWQRAMLGDENDPKSVAAEQIGYWRNALAGLPGRLELPADRPRPALASSRGGVYTFEVDAQTTAKLDAIAQDTGASLFMVVHAAFAALLTRLSGSTDIAIGTPVAGRGEAELDGLIGMFVNMLVLRTESAPGASFRELVESAKKVDLAAFSHVELPFERLVEVLDPARSQAHHPLFQVALFFQNMEKPALELPGLSASALDLDGAAAKFDLQLTVTPHEGENTGLSAMFSYATDLFDEATVARFAARFRRLLRAVTADPDRAVGDADLLSLVERDRILFEWNDTRQRVAPHLLLDGYRQTVAANPEAVALAYEGTELTYREFDERVNKLARLLISQGVGAESLVGLAIRRSIDLVVGMYAIVTAGGAYVPLDPNHPAERIAHILDTAQPACVVTTSADAVALPDGIAAVAIDTADLARFDGTPVRADELLRPVSPLNPAYVIFTSGSTGRPKGVAVSHAAINNQIEWMLAEYPLNQDDVYLQKTATTFDVSLWGFFMPLRVGAKLVVATPDGHRDPAYVAETIAAQSVTVTDFVPSMLTIFAAHTAKGAIPTLEQIFVIGEALPPETVTAVHAVIDADVHNLYGPTEAAVSVTYWPADGSDTRSVPIGLPQWNTRVYVLDARLRPVPDGVAGELYLAGDQLARGYVRRPDLTADRFVANPFGTGQRMYRTGDLVVWRKASGADADEDMVLDYLGRTDFQVKFRGQRIELGEIETALLAQPSVSQSVALVSQSTLGDQLVAYAVAAPGDRIDPQELRAAIAETLPTYMVPSAIVALDELPLNPSGKLDRKALPEPMFTAREFRAPATPVEEIVAGVFGEVLGLTRVGADDDFFALGGNSLIATQVVARLGAAIGGRVPVRTLFEAPTVAGLAAVVDSQVHSRPGVELGSIARPDELPLSLAQRRMWFLNRFDQSDDETAGSAAYNLPFALRLTGALDVAALGAALHDVVARHEVLRTVYPETADGPIQVVLPPNEVALDVTPRLLSETDVASAVYALASSSFDVTTEVPVRVALLQVDGYADAYVLAVVVHHIAADGSSMGPLVRDVMIAYAARTAGEAPSWAPLRVQYADYALWQRAVLGDEADAESIAAQQISFWRSHLADLPDLLELPTDRPRPAIASMAGARVDVEIDAATHAGLVELARAHGATLFMVVHTALAVLLARLSGSADVAIGTPLAGRGERELDDLIGMFVNTVVFRTQFESGESFVELLGRQRESDLQAFAHADIPFERLVEVLNPPRSTAHHPLFQVGLSFQNIARAALELPGLAVSGLDADLAVSQFDLHLIVGDGYDESGVPTGMGGFFTYATDLFDAATVQGFAERFARILAAVVADATTPVGDIEVLDEIERDDVLGRWNATEQQVDQSATLVSLLDAAVAADPRSVALVVDLPAGREKVTYEELDARVNRLARYLISVGVGPESRVALAFRRSADLVVAMYAVAKSGGAYVPVDPDQGAERTSYILETAAPVCVLTNADAEFGTDVAPLVRIDELDLDGLDASPVTDGERVAPLHPENTAYVIFTSGSTGRPKGVAVSHGAIANQLQWKVTEFGLDAADAILLKTAATFDLSVWEFWSAAVCGGRLVIAAHDGHRDPAYLNDLMSREWVTTLHVVPSMLDALTVGDFPTSLWRVLAIGEALPSGLAQRFLRDYPRVELFNLYGPTEAAVSVTSHRVTRIDQASVPVGAPEWNSQVFVLDSRLRPVPVGVSGELYLAGAQLARGYFGRADLTSDRFVANPFQTGARMYRTGDLVAWHASGELEYRGRTDFQVKIRGFRIELAEIDAALLALPQIAQAAVIAKSDPRTGDRLVAYLVPAAADVDVAEVKSALTAGLPSYMVPAAFVVLDALPLNVNGKLDRKALPEPEFEAQAFRAPSTPIEEIVASVYAEVLGVEQVGADDDFFGLGGNSLLATQVAARIGAALDSRVPVRTLFEASTVAGLAAKVERYAGTGGRKALVAGPRPEQIPLSLAQQRMWFLNQFDTGSAVYNIPAAIRLSGELDVAALQAAVTDLVARHEILRTTYPQTQHGPVQSIAAQVPVDLTPAQIGGADVVDAVYRVVAAGFDVTTEVPFRAKLFQVTDTADYVLVFVAHHISADGWSMGPLTRDLMLAYAARTGGAAPAWAPLPVQYADYSIWQREVLGDEADPQSLITQQADYWRIALAALPDELALPADRPRPAAASYRGATLDFEIDAELHAALDRVAQQHNSTLFMVVHAALAVLLARLSGSTDIAIGTPVAGRGEAELDDMIGMFVNTLVLRNEIEPGATFDALLADVRDTDVAAFGHADLPFERLVELLDPVRSAARHPLFQVMLVFQNLAQASLELPGLTVSGIDPQVQAAKFDLQLTVAEQPDTQGISAILTYATDLFDAATVQNFADRFRRILAAVAADAAVVVGDIDVLAAGERELVLHEWNSLGAWVPGATLPGLIADQVWRRPDAVAIRFGDRTLTFRELQRRANQVARALIAQGAGPESLVAVAVPRTEDLPVALLGVLATGAAYLPIDSAYPAQRLEFMLADAAPVCVLTTADERAVVPTGDLPVVLFEETTAFADAPVHDADRLAPLHPDNLAYVIYTSGSTGVPKGVGVAHRNVVELFANTQTLFRFDEHDVWTLFHSFAFDFSVWELWCGLAHGGSVVVVDYVTSRSPEQFRELLIRERVTVLNQTPSAFYQLVEADRSAEPSALALRYVVFGGEALDLRKLERWYERHGATTRLVNMYGITETTVHVSFLPLDEQDRRNAASVIGRAIPGLDAYVLDPRLHPTPLDVPGEIHVVGAQLSRGYLGKPGLTAARFVANPFGAPGSRMYRTGDVGRWRDCGDKALLEYAGRSDQQVQLRGFRIELGEIEAALVRCDGVNQAVALVRSDAHGDRLIGYVVSDGAADIDPVTVRSRVAEFLTGYMVPDAIVVLDSLPLTPNGKLDRKALPAPEFVSAHTFRAPSSALEQSIAAVFADLLGAETVGLDDDFFTLGGNSLLAAQAVGRLREVTGATVSVQWFFTDATVAGLATRIDTQTTGETDPDAAMNILLPIRSTGTAAPLFCLHPMYGLAWSYAGLTQHLPAEQPIYGVQSPALSEDGDLPDSIAELAHRYVAEIRTVQPHGPYRLLGWSLGGVLAHAIATELQAGGEQVALLAMMDSHPNPDVAGFRAAVRGALAELGLGGDLIGAEDDIYDLSDQALAALHAMIPPELVALTPERLRRIYRSAVRSAELIAQHRPGVFDGTLEYFSAAVADPADVLRATATDWSPHVTGAVVDRPVGVTHAQMTAPEALAEIGAELAILLGRLS